MAIALQADGGGKASNAASDDEDAERLAFRFLHDNVEAGGLVWRDLGQNCCAINEASCRR